MAILLNNLLLNVVPVAIIFAVAIWAIWTELKSVSNYKQELELTKKAIKFLKENQSRREIPIQGVGEEIRKWLFDFVDGQLESSKFIPRKEDNRFVLLSYPNILSKPVPRSTVYYAPTLLTALGIFGTFFGISLGISRVNLGELNDTSSLLTTSTQLLSGMKTAFYTSLAGLSGAIPLMFIIARQTKQKERYRNQLRKDLSEVAFLETSERLLSRFDHTSSRDAAKTLEDVARNLKGLNQLNPNAIGNAVKQALASEDSLLVQQLKEIQKLQKIQNEQFNPELIAKAINQELKLLISPISQKLEKIDHLVENTNSLPQLTPDAIATKTKQQLEPHLTKLLANTINLPQLTPEAIAIQTAEQFRLIIAPFSQDLGKIREIQETQTQTVELLVQQLRSELIEPVVERLDQSANLTQEASGLMNQAKDNLLGTLSNIDVMLQNTRQTVQQELERFRLDYQAALSEFFTEQNNLLNDTLGQQREGLAQVVANLQNTFQEEIQKRQEMSEQVNQSLAKIKQTVETVSNLANTFGLTSGERLVQLTELAREIGNEAIRVEKAYQNMTNQFNETLIKGNKQLAEYLQIANESYTNNLTDFDLAAAQVCQKLDQNSHGLMSVAQYLVAAANELKNGNGSNE